MQYAVSIVIPTKNRYEKVNNCLNSIYKSTLKNLQIILIDDNSNLETKEKIIKNHKNKIHLVENKKSVGVGVCRNIGAKLAKSNYVLFVDDDNIVEVDMIEKLYNSMEKHKNICIMMPLMYFKEDKKVLFYSGCITSLFTTYLKILPLERTVKNPFHDLGINTAPNLFMVRKKQGDEVDWFDAYLKGVYTDMDFYLRLKKIHKNTFIAINPFTKCWHDTPLLIRGYRNDTYKNLDRMYLLGRNRGIIMKRYASLKNLFVFSIFFYPAFTIYYSYKILSSGAASSLFAFLKGTLSGYFYILNGARYYVAKY